MTSTTCKFTVNNKVKKDDKLREGKQRDRRKMREKEVVTKINIRVKYNCCKTLLSVHTPKGYDAYCLRM